MTEAKNSQLQRTAAYLNSCYQADNREHSLWNVFADKNELLALADTQQLFDLHNKASCFLDAEYGQRLENNTVMYRREKMLLFGQWFVCTRLQLNQGLNNRSTRICAPLLFYEASFSADTNQHQLLINQAALRWNQPLVRALLPELTASKQLDQLLTTNRELDVEALMTLLSASGIIDSVNLNAEIRQLGMLKGISERVRKNEVTLVPGGCFVLTKRSTSSRGIIDELNTLAAADKHPTVVRQLYTRDVRTKRRNNRCQPEYVPGLLSSAQQKALYNAARHDLSVLIGPPGTGKSYTIACIILERFMQGEKVLLVTQNEAAVDVVQEKLTAQLGVCASAIIRTGGSHHHQDLKRKLADILSGSAEPDEAPTSYWALRRLIRSIRRSEQRFIRQSAQAVDDGLFISDVLQGKAASHWFSGFKQWLVKRRIGRQAPLIELLNEVHQLHAQREALLSSHINARYQRVLHKLLRNNREQLAQFDSALRARTSLSQESRFLQVDHSALLTALPIWLGSLSALHRSLPMQAELFDLVIIDEATQCDMASCLPALYRAKRAMVVGDPKQLRHLSFLSASQQQRLLEQHQLQQAEMNLNYRERSMIDLATAQVSSQEAVVMLDEHYRSVPDIIGFSNQQFYHRHLKIMTRKPGVDKKPAIRVLPVTGGERRKGVNEAEIKALMAQLESILEFQQHLPAQRQQSIGILAFFREQADAIKDRLISQLSSQVLIRHRIKVDTPYGFQGEERDIMLLSCAVCAASPAGTYRYLDRPDVFNVAVTRARDLQYVLLSVPPADLPAGGLLKQYMTYIADLGTVSHKRHASQDRYIDALGAALQQAGLSSLRNYQVAGVSMDLMVVDRGQAVAIDLIGFPGEHQAVLHIERYHVFARAELTIYPLSLGRWLREPEAVIADIKQLLRALYEQSIRQVSVAFRARLWKPVVEVDPLLARLARQAEHRFIAEDSHVGLQQLKQVTELCVELDALLKLKFNPGELTFLRYQHSIIEVVKEVLTPMAASAQPSEQQVQKTREAAQQAIIQLQNTAEHLQQLKTRRTVRETDHHSHLSELKHLNQTTGQFADDDLM